MRKFPSGSRLELFESLDSTSTEARRRVSAGERGPVWIVALHQTAGYGRRGRAWEQQGGDFAGTLLFSPEGDAAAFGQLSFVAALAAYDAIAAHISSGALALKWPNDILIDGAKTAGLLLEYVEGAPRPVVTLGIGVNIVSKPDEVPYPAARLMDHIEGDAPAVETFAAALDRAFDAHYQIWRRDGFGPVRKAWLEKAHGIGKSITVRLPGGAKEGVFEDIDENGALILRSGAETQIISAGDVFFGPQQF